MDSKPTNESLGQYCELLSHLPAGVTLTPLQVLKDIRKMLAADNEHLYERSVEASEHMSPEYGAAFKLRAEAHYLNMKSKLRDS